MEGQCLLVFRINNDDNGHLGSNGEADSKIVSCSSNRKADSKIVFLCSNRKTNSKTISLCSNREATAIIARQYPVASTERQIARYYLVAPTERRKPISTSHLSSNQNDLEKAGEKLNESPRQAELSVFLCRRTVMSRMNQKLEPLLNDTDLNCNRLLEVGGYGRRLSANPEAWRKVSF
ncbi:uncharacterized protein EAF02_003359 [Botrytis sinoallii]|uniref:uncharacterized protein n=1 Tax=Botrytis sinoallii TaxID=1463999 RepID=UPI001902426D|nr:uncharacterized protein EAF02_003359 [Botrytis sinoallii]KAF7886712.1 hypothetical protein EAF02_003359 [Botrytis sinoallii]